MILLLVVNVLNDNQIPNDDEIVEGPTYSYRSGVTGPSSIVIMNLGDIVHRVLEIIKQLDECIEATIDVHGNSNPTGGASAQHH
ncbi:unnamed protein product [Rotaria magnacalcarata]|uniref:Uncharacterized protein n=1 Tax=Rotaria magnacalcarata TaxID=392030 RepID=A0A815MSM4_9BILA|nr:unnamed protein product [Rotaria magnacalcarata]